MPFFLVLPLSGKTLFWVANISKVPFYPLFSGSFSVLFCFFFLLFSFCSAPTQPLKPASLTSSSVAVPDKYPAFFVICWTGNQTLSQIRLLPASSF